MKKAKTIIKLIVSIIITSIMLLLLYIGWLRVNAKKCVKSTISSFSSGDYTKNFYYLDINGNIKEYMEVGTLGNAILQNTTFDIVEYNFNLKSPFAKVTMDISYPNIFEVYQIKYSDSSELISSDIIQDELLTSIIDKNYSKATTTLTFDIFKYNKKWYLLENEDFMNVYSGGLYNQYKQAINESRKDKEN